MQFRFIIYLFLFISISACGDKKTQSINPLFVPYVDAFFEEAKNRNINIALSDFDLTMRFAVVDEFIGTCNTGNVTIEIDRESWRSFSNVNKEWLIFHELGHCILGRDHNNEKNDNGECRSVMNETINNLNCSTNLCSSLWKDYYFDELFEVRKDFPDWYTQNPPYADGDNRIYQVDTTIMTDTFLLSREIDLENNFVLEAEFFDFADITNVVSLRWGNNYFSFLKSPTSNSLEIETKTKRIYRDYNVPNNNSYAKLTIKRLDNQYWFYFNEKFVHTFEYTDWDSDIFGAAIAEQGVGDVVLMDVKFYILGE